MKLKVSLSIGFPSACKNAVIEVDDDEYNDCETDEERNDLLSEYWQDWANNNIDGDYEIVED